MLLDDIKILLGIDSEDSSRDKLLNLYIKRAIYTIKVYLNNDELTDGEIESLHREAILSLVVDAQRSETNGTKGIKSMKQGARSITYADDSSFTITNAVKAILPIPYIRMR